MKTALSFCIALCVSTIVSAADLPRGTFDAADLDKAKAKAAESGKLIAYLYTDKDSTCSLCQGAVEAFVDAAKSKAVFVYVDSPSTAKIYPSLPRTVQDALRPGKYIPKMAVTDSAGEKVVASVNYDSYEKDETKALREFKKALKTPK